MMKKIFFTLLILVLACQLTAQQRGDKKDRETVAIGIRVGGNLASYYYPNYEDYNNLPFDDSLLRRTRPMLGLNVEIPLFGGIVYVAPEVDFVGRGDSRVYESAAYGKKMIDRRRVNYLEARVPISVAIPATSWFKPYVFAAPTFGVALGDVGPFASVYEQYPVDEQPTADDQVLVDAGNTALYDYGFTAGAGLRFLLNFNSFKMVLKLEGGYHMGFLDVNADNPTQPLNVQAYNAEYEKRFNRGIEGALTIAIPLDFHSSDDCFYWSDVQKKKNKSRGLFGF